MTAKNAKIAYIHSFASPVGTLHAVVDRKGRVMQLNYGATGPLPDGWIAEENKYACGELEYQLEQYFARERQSFSLELNVSGTGFQKAVWSRLTKIEYGKTATYGYVAQKIGRREAARAVGNAVAANPVVIIVPCHRVVRSDGSIGAYAARSVSGDEGQAAKRYLLELEGAMAQSELFSYGGA